MLKYSDVVLQPLKSHRFKLLVDLSYKGVTVPAGYRSDGASVPRILWSIFPPNRTDYLPCAIIHDYLCDKEEYKKADSCFKACLKDLSVDMLSRTIMWFAVRFYHKFKYGI